MKRLILAAILIATPALAADPVSPPNPTCGKTIEDCEKVVDDLRAQMAGLTVSANNWQSAYNEAIRERDAAAHLSAFVSELKK